MSDMPSVGAAAPSFSLESSAGGTLSSDDLRGRPYLLFFYPKSGTPG